MWRAQIQQLASLGRRCDFLAKRSDDSARAFNELPISCVDTAVQVKIVLQADPHIATE